MKAYPKDVNFVYKNYPLPATMHPQAMPAAKAAVAAQKQGKFWEMHDKIFQNARGGLSNDKYKEWAKDIGLDVAKFEKDMASSDVDELIQRDMTAGRSAEVTGTPSFYVNGKRVMNRSVDGFKEMIDVIGPVLGRQLKYQGEKKS